VNFVVMSCYLIMPIWFNLFQIDSSIITIQNSYALQGRSLRIAVKDWYRVLTDELLCTPPLNGRVDNSELHCLALFTLGYRHVPSRNVEAALCVKYVGHDKRGNCDFISMMAIQANCIQLQDKCMSLLERILPHGTLTYDWAVVCNYHPEFMQNLRRRLPEGLYQGPQ
jgi:hypothetical protein